MTTALEDLANWAASERGRFEADAQRQLDFAAHSLNMDARAQHEARSSALNSMADVAERLAVVARESNDVSALTCQLIDELVEYVAVTGAERCQGETHDQGRGHLAPLLVKWTSDLRSGLERVSEAS